MFCLFLFIFWYEATYDQKKKIYYKKISDRMLVFGEFASYLRKLHFASTEGLYPISQVSVNVFLQSVNGFYHGSDVKKYPSQSEFCNTQQPVLSLFLSH